MGQQRPRRRQRVGAPGTDRSDSKVRLEHIARSREDERLLLIRDHQQRLEPPQKAIGAPVFTQLDAGSGEVSLVFLELGFEALEQCESVRGATGESSDHTAVPQASY